jgi:hypothetical protein
MPKNHLINASLRDRRDVWNADLQKLCKYDGYFEMPVLPVCHEIPQKLTAFSKAKIETADASFLHFFEDDYKFERIWRDPHRYLSRIQAYGGVISPDFSVYREMPLLQQMYNIFRSRVIGQWLSRNGVIVVPNIRWGDERTYDCCFDGLPKNSVLAIGTHGCAKHIDDRRCLFDGLMIMRERLQPKAIVVYGSSSERILPPLFMSGIELISFKSDYSLSRQREAV